MPSPLAMIAARRSQNERSKTMSYRITKAALQERFEQYVSALDRLDMIPEGYRVVLQHGSNSNGIAYRAWLTGVRIWNEETQWYDFPNGSGVSAPPTGDDFLGITKAEAHTKLPAITRTLWEVARHQGR